MLSNWPDFFWLLYCRVTVYGILSRSIAEKNLDEKLIIKWLVIWRIYDEQIDNCYWVVKYKIYNPSNEKIQLWECASTYFHSGTSDMISWRKKCVLPITFFWAECIPGDDAVLFDAPSLSFLDMAVPEEAVVAEVLALGPILDAELPAMTQGLQTPVHHDTIGV